MSKLAVIAKMEPTVQRLITRLLLGCKRCSTQSQSWLRESAVPSCYGWVVPPVCLRFLSYGWCTGSSDEAKGTFPIVKTQGTNCNFLMCNPVDSLTDIFLVGLYRLNKTIFYLVTPKKCLVASSKVSSGCVERDFPEWA